MRHSSTLASVHYLPETSPKYNSANQNRFQMVPFIKGGKSETMAYLEGEGDSPHPRKLLILGRQVGLYVEGDMLTTLGGSRPPHKHLFCPGGGPCFSAHVSHGVT